MSMIRSLLAACLALACSVTAGAQQPPVAVAQGLNCLFQAHVNQSLGLVPGHVIRVEKPGEWVYENAAGLAVITPPANAEAAMKFKIASITKLFTSTAVFQLIQRGKVDFDAPISTYLPLSLIQGFDDYQNIRVKDLLSHTSGIQEPQSDFQGRLNYWIFMKRFEEIPLDSLLRWSQASPVGVGKYQYSNANFYLLAEIIRSVTGDTYRSCITSNIITPLGLTNTDFNRVPTGSFMSGYLKGSFYPQGGVPQGLQPDSVYDFTEASNSWGYGAADLWSNTADLIRFHKALFGGELINSQWLDTMKRILTLTGDMGSYGYGMMQFNSYNNGPVYGLGHTGTAFGYGAMLCYVPSLNVYMCSAGNYMKIGQEFLQRDIFGFLQKSTAVPGIPAEPVVSAFPNPAMNVLNLSTPLSEYEVRISDAGGKEMFWGRSSKTIDVSGWPAGFYVLKLRDLMTGKVAALSFEHR